MAFLTQNKIMQNFDHNIDFWEKRQFFAENCRKSQKIEIITSTPGASPFFPTILFVLTTLLTRRISISLHKQRPQTFLTSHQVVQCRRRDEPGIFWILFIFSTLFRWPAVDFEIVYKLSMLQECI
jgi:hypothetical protein